MTNSSKDKPLYFSLWGILPIRNFTIEEKVTTLRSQNCCKLVISGNDIFAFHHCGHDTLELFYRNLLHNKLVHNHKNSNTPKNSSKEKHQWSHCQGKNFSGSEGKKFDSQSKLSRLNNCKKIFCLGSRRKALLGLLWYGSILVFKDVHQWSMSI